MYEYNKPTPLKILLRKEKNGGIQTIECDLEHLPEISGRKIRLDENGQLYHKHTKLSASRWTPIEEDLEVKVEVIYKAQKLDWVSKRNFFTSLLDFFRNKCEKCAHFDYKAGYDFLNKPTHIFDDKSERNMHVDYADIIARHLCIRGIDKEKTGLCKQFSILVPTTLPACKKWIR
jgi:hypothetical protein